MDFYERVALSTNFMCILFLITWCQRASNVFNIYAICNIWTALSRHDLLQYRKLVITYTHILFIICEENLVVSMGFTKGLGLGVSLQTCLNRTWARTKNAIIIFQSSVVSVYVPFNSIKQVLASYLEWPGSSEVLTAIQQRATSGFSVHFFNR